MMSFEFGQQEPEPFHQHVDEYTHLLTELHESYCKDQPIDILQYCANFFNKKLQEQRTLYFQRYLIDTERHPLAPNPYEPAYYTDTNYQDLDINEDDNDDDEEYEDEDDDEDQDKFTTAPLISAIPNYNRNRRTSVSAESMTPSSQQKQLFVKKIIPKTQAQEHHIKQSVHHNFLFQHLDEEHHQDVVNAMVETPVQCGGTIIEQGGVGDFFYVVQSGTLDCFIDAEKVTSYAKGGSFGELALMYNAPRAATIIATSDSVLWALDRVTFRTILMENTSQKRKMYESFLEEVPLLKSLKPYERHKIADALESVYIQDGDHVVLQGDTRGDQFYLIESGEALVYKVDTFGDQQEVNQLERGAYFGELALLNDSPRAATVVAKGKLKCATLSKKAFTRLLGSVHTILKRNSENYHAIINQQ